MKGEILSLGKNHELVISSRHQQSVVYVKCDEGDYKSVSPQAAEMLLAVSNYQQRCSIFLCKNTLLHKAMNLSLGDSVTVKVANNPELKAVVKYCGPLKGCDGLFFGVQLQVYVICNIKSW